MAIYITPDELDWKVCPYDGNHFMPIRRLHDHVLKCEKNPRNQKIVNDGDTVIQVQNQIIFSTSTDDHSTSTTSRPEITKLPPLAKSIGSVGREKKKKVGTFLVTRSNEGEVDCKPWDGDNIHDYDSNKDEVTLNGSSDHLYQNLYQKDWFIEEEPAGSSTLLYLPSLRRTRSLIERLPDGGYCVPRDHDEDLSVVPTAMVSKDCQSPCAASDSGIGSSSAPHSRCTSPDDEIIFDDPSILSYRRSCSTVLTETNPVLTERSHSSERFDRLQSNECESDAEEVPWPKVSIAKSRPLLERRFWTRLSHGPLKGIQTTEDVLEEEDDEQKFANCSSL